MVGIPVETPSANPAAFTALRAALGLPQPYLGQIADRAVIHTLYQTGNKQANFWSTHRAADDITGLQIGVANWYSNELSPGNILTVRVGIEYPIGSGTTVQMLVGGAPSLVVADGDQALFDLTPLGFTIPRGAQFRIRQFITGNNGFCYSQFTAVDPLDRREFAASGLADKSVSGSLSASPGNNVGIFPIVILGVTTRPSVAGIGDSIMFGQEDLFDDQSGNRGIAARSLAPYYGFANFGLSGEQLGAGFVSTQGAKRRALAAAYFSHVVINYGSNDLANSRTAATLLSDYATLAGFFPTQQKFTMTVLPRTTSSDGWATVANQTVPAWEAERLTNNRAHRGVLPGYQGVFDVASYIESGLDSGKWDLLKGGGAPTADGIHPAMATYAGVRRSGIVNAGLIRR